MRILIGMAVGVRIMLAPVQCDRAPEAYDLGGGPVIIDGVGR